MCRFTLKQFILFDLLFTFHFHIILSCSTNLSFTSLENVTASMASEELDPHTIELHWTFACPEEAALINEYQILYCPIAECNYEGPSEALNQNKSSTVRLILHNYRKTSLNLENLRSNTTYRIHLSSPNLNQTYTVYGRTDFGVPEGVIDIDALGGNYQSPTLIWTIVPQFIDYFAMTLQKGPDEAYVWTGEANLSKCNCGTDNACSYTLPPTITLLPNTWYDFGIRVCNFVRKCSAPYNLYTPQTPYDRPGVMLPPILEKLNETAYRAHFDSPVTPNGPISQYAIQQVDSLGHQESFTFPADKKDKIIDISVQCVPNSTLVRQAFKVQIAAINIWKAFHQEDTIYAGNFSKASEIKLCYNAAFDLPNSKSILWIILASLLGCFALLIVLYFLYNGSQQLQAIKRKARAFQIKILSNEEKQELEYSVYPVLPGKSIEKRILNSFYKLDNNQQNVKTLGKPNSG